MPRPLSIGKYPKAILHIDGDAFFASCEQARNPDLRGKAVVTGKERGIASSMSYEAKALGITRATSIHEIKKRFPDVIVIPSDYETYSLLSKRFYDVVRRYTPEVEEYGIDECFADLTGWQRPLHMSYQKIAEKIQRELAQELGFTFSIGLASTKVLAKIGSKWQKPHGLTAIPNKHIHLYLDRLAVGDVWGIGPQTTALLHKYGVRSALDFCLRSEDWVKQYFAKPQHEIWQELRGKSVMPLADTPRADHYSVQKMRTFTPPSNNPQFVFSQLCKNIEAACIKVRGYKLEAKKVSILLRTQGFDHLRAEVTLSRATNFAHEIIDVLRPVFEDIYQANRAYRATMVNLSELRATEYQGDLFGGSVQVEAYRKLYAGIDTLRQKYGKDTVHFGSSFEAHQFSRYTAARDKVSQFEREKFKGETEKKRVYLPTLNVCLE
jgi:DNA polymerase IV